MTLELNIRNKNFKVTSRDETIDFGYRVSPGIHYWIHLNDKYVVSVIKTETSYGREKDLWEIGLLRNYGPKDDELVHIEEDFDLGDDVIGWLTEDEVNDWIEKFYKKYVEGEG